MKMFNMASYTHPDLQYSINLFIHELDLYKEVGLYGQKQIVNKQ